MPRLVRPLSGWYALLTRGAAIAWLLALVATTAGLAVGETAGTGAAALLLTAAMLLGWSIVGGPGRLRPSARPNSSMLVRARTVGVLRSCDPDAAGRPRPRAPGV